jgi:hypothetical protein
MDKTFNAVIQERQIVQVLAENAGKDLAVLRALGMDTRIEHAMLSLYNLQITRAEIVANVRKELAARVGP